MTFFFLDIELGDSNGIDIAKQVQQKNKSTIILVVTSYNQYLDDAMDIDVARYINKPIDESRIISSLEKAISLIRESVITLHLKNHQIVRLKQCEIVYAEARLKKVIVYTTGGNYQVKETMKQLKDTLMPSHFAVPHNSYIVNLDNISNYKRDEIIVKYNSESHSIPISARKQIEFKRQFLEYIDEDLENDKNYY